MTLSTGWDFEEAAFLAQYDPTKFPPIAVTVDTAVLAIRDETLCVLGVQRANPPFKGYWSLPGRFVQPDETLEEAVAKGINDKARVIPSWTEQLGTYSDPRRDPRMRVISVAYVGFDPKGEPKPGYHADDAAWIDVFRRPVEWAFDHGRIVNDAVRRAQSKLEYTPLATRFLPETFTVTDLRQVYEAVWNQPLTQSNFHRKATTARGFLTPTREKRGAARLYKAGPTKLVYPPIRRERGEWL